MSMKTSLPQTGGTGSAVGGAYCFVVVADSRDRTIMMDAYFISAEDTVPLIRR